MLRIGLTGGIGAGKSVVAARLAELGAVLIDADVLAREAVARGTPGLAAVVEAFGAGMLLPDGSLDRPKLGAAVFGDHSARATLNGIVHPLVGARSAALVASAPADAVVVHDVPLLVENGLAPSYHLVVVVDAPVNARIERLARTRGMTSDEARARMAAQATDSQRQAVADVLLVNDRGLSDVRAQVDALWSDRLVPYAANLAAARPAAAPTQVQPYDPEWPAQFDRASARLRAVLGERAERIDHIGPTAVPGGAASDVLEVLVHLRTTGEVDGAVAALAGTGWVGWTDAGGAATGWADGAERSAGHADPGRPACLWLHAAHHEAPSG